MQRLDKSLKKWGLPKVCSQRVYSFLCVPRGEVFDTDFGTGYPRSDRALELGFPEPRVNTIFVVHKSSEKWVWVLEYRSEEGKFDLVSDKYIKKKLLWKNKVPYVMFRDTFYEYYKDKRYYLNHALRVPPRLGVLRKVDYETAVK